MYKERNVVINKMAEELRQKKKWISGRVGFCVGDQKVTKKWKCFLNKREIKGKERTWLWKYHMHIQ